MKKFLLSLLLFAGSLSAFSQTPTWISPPTKLHGSYRAFRTDTIIAGAYRFQADKFADTLHFTQKAVRDSASAVRSVAEFGRLYDTGWITANSAALINSGATPIVLQTAITGRYIIPEFIIFEYTAGAIGFVNGAVVAQCSGVTGDLTAPISITGTGSFLTIMTFSSSLNSTSLASNAAIVLTTLNGAAMSAGNGSVRARMYFRRITP